MDNYRLADIMPAVGTVLPHHKAVCLTNSTAGVLVVDFEAFSATGGTCTGNVASPARSTTLYEFELYRFTNVPAGISGWIMN